MIVNRQSPVFKTIIPLKNLVVAEQFRSYQSEGHKAKQVYLNTLAVSAVSLYLNSIGWVTSLADSDSWNPAMQTIMDVADLYVPSYGKLECRFVLGDQNAVRIPPEVWSGRIGFVIVRLNKSLTHGEILGFVPQVNQLELPLDKLESLTEFPRYLSQQKQPVSIKPVTLHQWFDHDSDRDWQSLETLFSPQVALNFRSPRRSPQRSPQRSHPKIARKTEDRLSTEVDRVKLITLGENSDGEIALLLNVRPKDQQEFDISLTVCNSQLDNFLPRGLEIIVMEQGRYPVMIAQAKENKTIEFCFSGMLGENFSIELALEEQIKIESFII